MKNFSFNYVRRWLLLFAALRTTGTTILGSSDSSQAWADVIEGTEGPDEIFGTLGDDIIDSKGGGDGNFGDRIRGDGSGDDVIVSGEGNNVNEGDTAIGDGSGDDVITSGEGEDSNYGDAIIGDGSGDDVILDSGGRRNFNYGQARW